MQIYNFYKISNGILARNNENVKIKKVLKKRNQGTQTDYRESEAQTDLWKPSLRLHSGANPEILTLTYPQWGDGLSAGEQEIEKIKRMRMKNAWEALLSPIDCMDRKTQEFIISVIDQEEWAFRDKVLIFLNMKNIFEMNRSRENYEKNFLRKILRTAKKELQRIADSRMEAMKDALKSVNHQKELKLAERFGKLGKYLREVREKKIDGIRKDFCRDLRKLSGKYYTKKIEELTLDPKKLLSASKIESYMEFTFDSDEFKYSEELKEKESLEDCDAEDQKLNLLTKYLSKNPLKIAKTRTRLPDELCIRETRWTDDQLRKLHDDLKKIRLNVIEKANLPSRKCRIQPFPLRKMSIVP